MPWSWRPAPEVPPVHKRELARRLCAEASDHTAGPGRLREIAALAEGHAPEDARALRAALVRNPSSPPDLLAKLAPRCWDALLGNPAAPLLPLESPGFFESVDAPAKRRLLRLGVVPEWMVRWVIAAAESAGEAQVALEGRCHVALYGEPRTADWQDRLRDALRESCAAATPTERAAHRELFELGLAFGWVASAAPPHPAEPAPPAPPACRTMRRLWDEAADPLTPKDRLRLLADRVPDVRPAVAANPSVGQALLLHLLRSGYCTAADRRAVAENPSATGEVLLSLLGDQEPDVRRAALRHPRSPSGAARICREAAFQRAEAPVCRLAALLWGDPLTLDGLKDAAESEWWTEWLAAAMRARQSRHGALLGALTRDGNSFVRAAARERLTTDLRSDFRL